MKSIWLATLLVIVLALAGWVLWHDDRSPRVAEILPGTPEEVVPLPAGCRDELFENDKFIVCIPDVATQVFALKLDGQDGKPLEKLERLQPPFVWAMNGGMYEEDLSPVGLFVIEGKELAPLNVGPGAGNFFMKPNGVFFVDQSGAPGVLETDKFANNRPALRFATQSGPMLVIDGAIHPRFEADGQSRNIRNGVGVDRSGRAVFAISRNEVSFGKLARLFQDALNCANAVYLDGAISAFHDGSRFLVGGKHPVGPIVVVSEVASGGNRAVRQVGP